MEPLIRPDARRAVVGLEIHAQLATRSKLFCACANVGPQPPNTRVCPVCLGLPGSLPVVNRAAVDLAVRAAVALGCAVAPVSRFARKNYFYPDLPRNYQITQHDAPLAEGGSVRTSGPSEREIVCRLHGLHLEEDAGKLVHDEGRAEVEVDLNRAGTPLVEIVTRPDLADGAGARAVLQTVRRLLRELEVCHGNLEAGNLRCDANVSLRPPGGAGSGTRVELKNLNSYRFVEQAVDAEIQRQRRIVQVGGAVVPETRGWDPRRRRTARLRAKEGAADYRYLTEPDLPPVEVSAAAIAAARRALPELPAERLQRLRLGYDLEGETAAILGETPAAAAFFTATVEACDDVASTVRWCLGEVRRLAREAGLEVGRMPLSPTDLAELIRREGAGEVTATGARQVLARMLVSGRPAGEVIAAVGAGRVADEETLRAVCREVVAEHPEQAAAWRGGDRRLLGFLMGRVMHALDGRADPHVSRRLLEDVLNQGP